MSPRPLLARAALRLPWAERALRAAALADLPGARSVAHAYTDVLDAPRVRTARLDGYTLRVDVAEYRGVASYFFGAPLTFGFLKGLVRPGDTCVDVGANMGHIALALAVRVGPRGRVVAFEPQPRLAAMLAASAADNGLAHRLVVDGRATYRASGEVLPLFLGDVHNSGVASLHERYKGGASAGQRRGDGAVDVETVTLADAFEQHGLERCRLLKIDVEGAELEALLGARPLLEARRIDAVLVETWTGSDAERLLLEAGYVGFRAAAAGPGMVPLADLPAGRFGDSLLLRPGLDWAPAGA